MFVGINLGFTQEVTKLRTKTTSVRLMKSSGDWGNYIVLKDGDKVLITIQSSIPKITIYEKKIKELSVVKTVRDTTNWKSGVDMYNYDCVDETGIRCTTKFIYSTDEAHSLVNFILKYTNMQYMYDAMFEK